jgi:hypothetical protein
MDNKLFFKIIILVSVCFFGSPLFLSNNVSGQYAGPGDIGSATLEEQLQLAREKITNAQQQGAYGSGTAMFGTNLDNTVLTIMLITVIMGGISGAFFVAGGRKEATRTAVWASQKGTHDDETFRQVSQQVEDLKKVIDDLQKKLASACQH